MGIISLKFCSAVGGISGRGGWKGAPNEVMSSLSFHLIHCLSFFLSLHEASDSGSRRFCNSRGALYTTLRVLVLDTESHKSV